MKDDEDVKTILGRLMESCNSNAQALRTAAQRARSGEVRKLLERRAEECAEAASKLRLELERAGGRPPDGGGRSDLEILEECEEGEDRVKARFEEALSHPLPEPVKEVLQAQHEGVLRNHQQIREMRERIQATA
jgi:hypothetical protein